MTKKIKDIKKKKAKLFIENQRKNQKTKKNKIKNQKQNSKNCDQKLKKRDFRKLKKIYEKI